MVTFFLAFAVVAICAAWFIVKTYERRQDVLYGPYIWREDTRRRRSGV